MWTCPECGRSFANPNQWHACQDTTVDEALAGKTDHAISIYRAVVGALEAAGEFRIHPQKTRIAFISRMTFAGVSLARRWADLSFILPEPLDDRRIRKLDLYGPTSWGHTIRLSRPDDIDRDVEQWLEQALKRGDQETLDPQAEVAPLNMNQLEVLWTGFKARIEVVADILLVRLPSHVEEALALVDEVRVRIMGVDQVAPIERRGGHGLLVLDPVSGLGDGDEVDVFIRAGD